MGGLEAHVCMNGRAEEYATADADCAGTAYATPS